MRSTNPLRAAFMFMLLSFQTRAQTKPATSPEFSFMGPASTVMASIQKEYFNDQTGLYARVPGGGDPDFMWGNGVMFSAVVAAARHEPAAYRPILDRFFAALDVYWDNAVPIPGYEPSPTRGNGQDKYYDDNQWMAITFLEAYELTHDARYLERADAALRFSLSGWDDQLGGGIWWHQLHKDGSKNTCANAPAAVACLRLARHRRSTENIEWAKKLVRWTTGHLQDSDALFFDNQRVADGRLNRTKFTYNTALMLRANLGLYRATGEDAYLTEARRISAACESFIKPGSGAWRDDLKFSHLLVEADLELYRATGDPNLLARARRAGQAAWSQWQTSPPKDLIEQAATARILWLLADQETQLGQAFWKKSDSSVAGAP